MTINRDEILADLSVFLKGEPVTLASYEELADAPYTVTQIKRVLGSWDRAMSLLPTYVAEVKELDPKKAVTK